MRGTKALAPLLLLLLLLPIPGALAQGPASEEIAGRLEEAARLLDAGDEAGAREVLEEVEQVEVAGGGEMALAGGAWLRLLEEQREEAPQILRATAALLREPAAEVPADAGERLERILARPEFQPVQPGLWQRIIRWLASRLPSFDGLPGGEATSNLLLWLVAGLSLLVVAAVLLSFLRGLRQSVTGGETLDSPLSGIPRDAADAQAQASEAASAGDYREAMRLLYLAALLHLDEIGLLRFDRALTNREVLATVPGDARLRPLLAPVISQFDRVWYGHAPFGQAEFERVRVQLEQLRQMEQ